MNKEIELKFEITDVPHLYEYNDIHIYKIIQNYLYQDTFSAIRKRQIFDFQNKQREYIYTVKTKGNIKNNNSIYEIETKISKKEYEIIQNTNNIIEKYRIKFPITENLIAELDLYYRHLKGLITVEVEFASEKDLDNFVKPKWFGNILDKNIYSNANLSKISRDDFINIIGQKKLKRNMILKESVEDYIKIHLQ